MAWYFLGIAHFMFTTKTLTEYDLGWEICAWSYFLSSIHDHCSEEISQSFESRSNYGYYTCRTWDLRDLLMECCHDINRFPGSCLTAYPQCYPCPVDGQQPEVVVDRPLHKDIVFFSVSDKCILTRKLTGKNYSNLGLRAPSVFLCNFKYSQTSRKQHPKCKGLVVAYGTRSLTRTEPHRVPF